MPWTSQNLLSCGGRRRKNSGAPYSSRQSINHYRYQGPMNGCSKTLMHQSPPTHESQGRINELVSIHHCTQQGYVSVRTFSVAVIK